MSEWRTPVKDDPDANVSLWADGAITFASVSDTSGSFYDHMDPPQARVLAAALIAAADEAESDQSDQPKGRGIPSVPPDDFNAMLEAGQTVIANRKDRG